MICILNLEESICETCNLNNCIMDKPVFIHKKQSNKGYLNYSLWCKSYKKLRVFFHTVLILFLIFFYRLQEDPPTGVSGAPTDNNIMIWNAVIFGLVIVY